MRRNSPFLGPISAYESSRRRRRGGPAALLLSSTCLLSLAAAALPAAALEADADEATLEPVVVTARKRSEDVQKVPIAISTLQAEQLKDGKLDELNRIMDVVPNVSFKNDQFTSSDISIRGSSRNTNAEEPGVGITRDGVYVGGLLTNTSTFYDLERVEILRGPQGGLYGRNSVGGAVNFFTARPSFDGAEGYVTGQYGTLSRAELRAAVNVPIIADKLAVRVSGLMVNQKKGFQHVVNLHEYTDSYDNASGRVRVRFTPVASLELLTTIEHYHSKGSPGGVLLNAPFGEDYVKAGMPFEAANSHNIRHLQLDVPTNVHGDQTQFIQEVNYTVDFGTLTGVYGYRSTGLFQSLDNDGTIIDESDVLNDAHQNATYADLRFASKDMDGFHFLVGATFLKESVRLNQEYKAGGLFGADLGAWYTTGLVTANPFGIPVGTPIEAFGLTPLGNSGGWSGDGGDSFPVTSINEQRLRSIAFYAEANYRVTDALEIWGSVRYTRDTKKLHFSQFFGNSAIACPVACKQVFTTFVTAGLDTEVTLDASDTFENFSPGGGLNYALNENAQLYAKVVTGFKAGGFNSLASSPDLLPFDSEKTISYEVGVKTRWWDNRMALNGNVFYQRRKGALVEVFDPLFSSLGVTYGVNAGLIENRGVELDGRVRPVQGLDISLAAGYLDSEFVRFVSGGTDYSGNRLPTVYRYTFSGVVTYEWPLTDQMDGFAYVSYSNRWKAYTNNDNARRARKPEQLDLRLGAKGPNWKVIGFVNNATNHHYAPFELYVPGPPVHIGTISQGRTAGVELHYEF